MASTEDGDTETALLQLQEELIRARRDLQADPTSLRWWGRVAAAFDAVAVSVAGTAVSAAQTHPHEVGEIIRLYSPWT